MALLQVALTVLLSVLLILCTLLARRKRKCLRRRLPPGPPGLPIVGNLLLLKEHPHRDLHRLAQQHGSIMFLRLGVVPTVVVSSPQAAHAFLKTHDLVFASRPSMEVGKYLAYDNKALSVSKYGPYWRGMRKLCTLELLSTSKVEYFKGMREREVGIFINSLKDITNQHDPIVNISSKVSSLTADITCLMVFGKRYTDEAVRELGVKEAIQEAMKISGEFHIADFIPFVGILDPQGMRKRMKGAYNALDRFFEQVIAEHKACKDDTRERDLVDVFLSLINSGNSDVEIQHDNMKAVLQEMLAAGIDTSATAIEWGFSEILRNPLVWKRLREEVDGVVGLKRMVNESDLPKLEYLDMVVKESMRLHPPLPLLIPHEAMEDCEVEGFWITRNSHVIVNVWAIGRHPDAWPNPEEFRPERFEGTEIDVKGRDFQLLPFGAGRRGCPGLQQGLNITRLVLARLVHCFDWELPRSLATEEIDMDEEFGLTVRRAHPLLAVPTYRLVS